MSAVPASGISRLAAYGVDLACVFAVGVAGWFAFGGSLVAAGILALELAIVFSLARAISGWTLGGLITGTVACSADGSFAPGLRAQAIRSLLVGLAHLTVIAPAILLVISKSGQDRIDRIAGTATMQLRARTTEFTHSPEPAPLAEVLPGHVSGHPHPGMAVAPPPPAPLPPTSLPPAHRPPIQGFQPPPAQAPVWPPAPPPVELQRGIPQDDSPAWPPPSAKPRLENTWAPTIQGADSVPRRELGFAGRVTQHAAVWVIPDTGHPLKLSGVLVFGREPTAAAEDQTAVTVPDPTKSLSRTHARMGMDAAGIWVEDCYSTNGTFCRLPDGRTIELVRGHRQQVPIGSIVLLGERTLTITDASNLPN